MARTRLGFDVGSGSIKIAVVRGDGLRVETVRLPENLADENGVTMEILSLLDYAVGSTAEMDTVLVSGDSVQMQFSKVTLAQTA